MENQIPYLSEWLNLAKSGNFEKAERISKLVQSNVLKRISLETLMTFIQKSLEIKLPSSDIDQDKKGYQLNVTMNTSIQFQ